MFELQRLGREKELLLEEKRQLRDEKLLLLMARLPAQAGSASISHMISHSARCFDHSNVASGSKKRSRCGDVQCDASSGVFSWHVVTPLTSRRMGPAAAAVRIGNAAHIIVTGGYNGDVDENVHALLRVLLLALVESYSGSNVRGSSVQRPSVARSSRRHACSARVALRCCLRASRLRDGRRGQRAALPQQRGALQRARREVAAVCAHDHHALRLRCRRPRRLYILHRRLRRRDLAAQR